MALQGVSNRRSGLSVTLCDQKGIFPKHCKPPTPNPLPWMYVCYSSVKYKLPHARFCFIGRLGKGSWTFKPSPSYPRIRAPSDKPKVYKVSIHTRDYKVVTYNWLITDESLYNMVLNLHEKSPTHFNNLQNPFLRTSLSWAYVL